MSGDTTPATIPGLEQDHVWLAEMLRVSVFGMPGAPLIPKDWKDVFGADKMPARLVMGVASLPMGMPIELEVILETKP